MQIFNGVTTVQLHDTIKIGMLIRETGYRRVYRVRRIDDAGKRVELLSAGRSPNDLVWVPFWMIDSSYRPVDAAEALDQVCDDLGLKHG